MLEALLEDMGGPLLVVIGLFFAFAVLGLVSSILYQWRQYRRRRIMRGD